MEEFSSVFRVVSSLEAFWRIFCHNVCLGRYQRLNEFCAPRLVNDLDSEAVWHFTSLMMTLQIKYLANFRNLNSQQLIEFFTIVVIRLENFSLVNLMAQPLNRLKASIRETITLLREYPRLGRNDDWQLSSLNVLETIDFQLTRERVRTVACVLRFFEIITRGVRFKNFHSPYICLQNVM